MMMETYRGREKSTVTRIARRKKNQKVSFNTNVLSSVHQHEIDLAHDKQRLSGEFLIDIISKTRKDKLKEAIKRRLPCRQA